MDGFLLRNVRKYRRSGRHLKRNQNWVASGSYSRPSMTGFALSQRKTAERDPGFAMGRAPLGDKQD